MDPDDSTAAGEAFDVLGDETRIDILRAFDLSSPEPVSFSALRERVGARDSGRFNYHLDKLVGRFVRRTDEGYELTTAGRRVHGAIHSGAYTGSASFEPIPLDDDADACQLCDGPLELRREDDSLVVACTDCGDWELTTNVTPSMVEGRDREAIPTVFSNDLRTKIEQVTAGICPLCSGPVSGSLERWDLPATDGHAGEAPESAAMAVFGCERCEVSTTATVGAVLLVHPATVSFYHDHGVDVRAVPIWRLALLHPGAATVEREDPLRVRVTVQCDGETLAATVDADLTVVDVERSPA